jgi:hypothetical protein
MPTIRLVEIADLLGAGEQSAHEIAYEKTSPVRSPKTLAADC